MRGTNRTRKSRLKRRTIRSILSGGNTLDRLRQNNNTSRHDSRTTRKRGTRSTTSVRRLLRRITTLGLTRMLITTLVTRLNYRPDSRREKSSKSRRNRSQTRSKTLLDRLGTRTGDSGTSNALRRKIASTKGQARRKNLSHISQVKVRILKVLNMLLLRKNNRTRSGNTHLQNTIMRHRIAIMDLFLDDRLLKIKLIQVRTIRHKGRTMRRTRIRLALMIPENLSNPKTPRRLTSLLIRKRILNYNYRDIFLLDLHHLQTSHDQGQRQQLRKGH